MSSALKSRGEGMGPNPTLSYRAALLIIVFLALAVYNTLEIIVKIFHRFQRYNGVYFYSMLAASIGIVIHALGYFLRNYDITNSTPLELSMICGGAILMVTGQSIVLWSRLHLISPGQRDLWLLWMIIAACIIAQGGATTLFSGSNSSHPEPWLKLFEKWEIFQVTWFVFQECLISGLYIYRTCKLMRSSAAFRGPDFRRVFNHLILVNVLVISLDLTIIAFQYAGLYEIQTSWKTLAYSIKLKFEFDILHQLVDFTKRGYTSQGRSSYGMVTEHHHHNGSGQTAGSVQEIANAHLAGPSFRNPSYTRMNDNGLKDVPLQKVMKTTETRVQVKEDVVIPGSTVELRAGVNSAM
ncbi:hypothetical protein BDU57DRAFT_133474 [Ampelomyces quisqualis]|uniref:DUF7703 domain-containing protein n=1 Tax=Ampelomyces quisqualis TaxID=50730 RepID=A0A6A5QWB1_AMPQU|nr:hypothetical protein BDU57DRAFT_133474 [Ampelomyces quisqualis]